MLGTPSAWRRKARTKRMALERLTLTCRGRRKSVRGTDVSAALAAAAGPAADPAETLAVAAESPEDNAAWWC